MAQYKQRHELEHVEPDEMIVSAGDYLVHVLEPVQQQLDRRKYLTAAAAAVGVAIGAVLLARWVWGGSSDTTSSTASSGSSSTSSSASNSGKDSSMTAAVKSSVSSSTGSSTVGSNLAAR